jgi:hypothetical protein
MPLIRSFAFESKASSAEARIDAFVAWAEPGGSGGFQSHRERYYRTSPYFDYSKKHLPHSHETHRSWFVRQEYLLKAVSGGIFSKARRGTEPEIRTPLALIPPGRFLSFGKAYVNVYCEIRGLRGAAKATMKALIFLEKALRELNKGNNDPSNLNHQTFGLAAKLLQRFDMNPSVCFDSGKALEHLSILVQEGGRFKGDRRQKVFPGFKLLGQTFSFKSPIKSPAKFGKKRETDDDIADQGHLSSEDVAAIGLAYRRAEQRYGPDGTPTFFGALMSLALTTASMRASELVSLREDALYPTAERYRLRIPRPKIGIEQDVPVSKRLGPLAEEIFNVVKAHSSEARAAFRFYLMQSPDSLAGVHTLYVPSHIKPLLKKEYLTKEQAHAVINPDVLFKRTFPQSLSAIAITYFVKRPGDVYGRPRRDSTVARIQDVIEACEGLPVWIDIPPDARRTQYIQLKSAKKLIKGIASCEAAKLALHALYSSQKSEICVGHISKDSVMNFLLSSFKLSALPHWPYTSKDHSVRLDSALAVHFEAGANSNVKPGMQRQQWWLPRLLSTKTLNSWVSGNAAHPPLLFTTTDVKREDETFPTVSIQRSRRYHHTAALLAGASPLFANELAGRQSGWQGEAYDYRTPRQIVRQSIDTYDPDQGSDVIGPIADEAPSPKRVVERRIFLAENAAPKHVTEIGGCRTDWMADPCDFHGDCIRCGNQVWRKGDQVRTPRIREMRAEAARAISVGTAKLRQNPRLKAIERQVRQQMETLDRCDFIIGIEADESIEVGTLVTFPLAVTAMSSTALRSRLRKLNL